MSKVRYVPDKAEQLANSKRYYASPKGQAKSRAYRQRADVRDRSLKRSTKWNKEHSDIRRAQAYQRTYGEPFENKAKRLEAQGGCCANSGCRTDIPGPKGWETDHNHVTGKVRGELCGSCNKALSFIKDDVLKAEGLALYMRQYK